MSYSRFQAAVTPAGIAIYDGDHHKLADLALAFAVGDRKWTVLALQETATGWRGLTGDAAVTVAITRGASHVCIELCGEFGPAGDVTYFAGSVIEVSHVHAFIPDANNGSFPVRPDKTYTLTNQNAMCARLGVKEELWMVSPQPHVLGFGTAEGRGFAVSIPECLPSDAVQFVVKDRRLKLDFIHHVAACDGHRMPRVYIDLGVDSRAGILDRHLGHARALGLLVAEKPQPAWWHNPLYCTWGDQVRLGLSGFQKEDCLTRERILGWADKIRTFYEGEVNFIIDDGYFVGMGDFRLRPELYGSVAEFRELIAELKRRNFRVILWYTPFWVAPNALALTEHPEWLLRRPDGSLYTNGLNGQYNYDWSRSDVRDHQRALIRHFLTELDADGFKIDMTFSQPPTSEIMPHDASWAAGNLFCKRAVEFIHTEASAIKPDVFLTINGVESYLQPFASAVRLNDLFNMTDATKWYERAELVTRLMPGVAIDVDGWPAAPCKLREYPFVASVYGAPVSYYLDGTEVGDVEFTETDINRMASVWATYAHAPVHGDEKIIIDAAAGRFERRSAAGVLRALSLERRVFIAYGEQAIRVTANTAMAVAVPLEKDVTVSKAVRVNRDGTRVPVTLHVEAGRVLFFAEDAGDGILYYELS